MSTKRIVAFGCSITRGEALPDVYSTTIDDPKHRWPSNYSWPSQLGKKLNLGVLNLGKSGTSNKYICKQMLDANLKSNDIVVFMWTYFARTCVFDDPEEKRIIPNYLAWKEKDNINISKTHRKHLQHMFEYCENYFRNYFTWQDCFYESLQQMNFAKLYLDSKGIKNYHTTCEQLPYRGTITKQTSWFKFNVEKEVFFDMPQWNTVNLQQINLYDNNAADEDHPSVKAHKRIAKDIYKFISKN